MAAPERLEATIRDDAPGERRRRSIEVLEERARTLGAELSVEQTDDGTTMRLVLPTYATSD
jgi:signal transduction histidine kinase